MESPLPQAILLWPTDGSLAMARALRRRGVTVRMLGEPKGELAWVTRTRWAETRYAGQLASDAEEWISQLEELAELGPGVLIPATDRAVELLARERERIPEVLRSFESPTSGHLELMDKGWLYDFASRNGVRFPWTMHAATREDLDRVSGEASFPCLVKPALSHVWRRLFGERRAIPVRDPGELARVSGPAVDAGVEVLVTEHIPGPDGNAQEAVTIRRADGSYPLAYSIRKVRMYPSGYGAGAINEIADLPDTMGLATALLDASEFVGVTGVETKRHAETGEMVLIEVNVRITTFFTIGDAAGTDASWRLYATLAGLPLAPQPAPRPGVRLVVPSLELRAVVDNLRTHHATPREIVAGYRGVRSWSGVSLLDPKPLFWLVARQLRGGLRFLWRLLSGSRSTT